MSLQHLWAKSYPEDPSRYHPLWCHLLDVAAVCQALVPRFGGILGLPDECLPYIVALHDIGKADAQFQNKVETLSQDLRGTGLWFPSEPDRGYRHEKRSAEWLRTSLEDQEWDTNAVRVVAQAVTGHHGNFQACAYAEEESRRVQWEPWRLLREELNVLVQNTLGALPLTPAPGRFHDASVAGMKLSGLIVLSDWIASNPETYRYPALFSTYGPGKEPDAYWQEAQEEAGRALRMLKLDGSVERSEPISLTFQDVWPDFAAAPPRPTQQALEEAVRRGAAPPGLAIIEAPMGEGKTEAAIYLATCWNRPGLFVALPTQATSNQMHGRLRRFLSGNAPSRVPRLVHGMAWLLEDETPAGTAQTWGAETDEDERQLSRDWFANAKRALLATDGVGTVDQVLMAALNVKHGFLRFLGLTTKTLIIDEVHAYDLYMTTLMKMLLRWCRALDVPVILLSATLSQAQKRSLAEAYGGPGSLPELLVDAVKEPYPLLTFVSREGQAFVQEVPADLRWTRVIEVHLHSGALGNPAEIARLAAESVAGGGCACVLANTVGSAQKIFRALTALNPADTELLLFHARFRAERRQQIEGQVAALFGKAGSDGKNEHRPPRAILVATQVVEQSLDIDFDVMLSEIAPIDLLLQRCGRLHRHALNNPRPTGDASILHVLLPVVEDRMIEFGGMEIKKWGNDWRGVYDRAALLRTLALLEGKSEISLPADFRPLIEGCYDPARFPVSSIPAEWITDAEKSRAERQAQSERKAQTHLIAEPSPRVFKYAQKPEPPVTEGEDGDAARFFRAQTREGDDSRSVLILHDPKLIAAVQDSSRREYESGQEWRPNKTLLRKLFLQKASLPAYWLAGVSPADGYEWLDTKTVPKRLRHHHVLIMRDDTWKGVQEKKDKETGKVTYKSVTITDDDVLGLQWNEDKET